MVQQNSFSFDEDYYNNKWLLFHRLQENMSKSIKPFNAKVVLIYVFYFHTIRCFPAIRKYFLDNCSHRNAASCFQYSFSLGTPTFSIYGSPRACLQAAASNQTYLERSIPVNLPRTQIGIQTRDLICS